DLIDNRNQPILNTFFRQKAETRHLAILLPGLGYTSHMPVMYYPSMFLLSRGADVLRAECNYVKNSDFMALQVAERRHLAAEDALVIYSGAIRQRDYETITLVGKSIGTYAMGHLISSTEMSQKLQCLWLTPILKDDRLISQIKNVRHMALFVTGTSDPYYDKANLDDLLTATGGHGIVI